jgi:hypothetical protein
MLKKPTQNENDEESDGGTISPLEPGPLDLISSMERCRIDRERIGVLRAWVDGNDVEVVRV